MILLQYTFWIFLILSGSILIYFAFEEMQYRRRQKQCNRLEALYHSIWSGDAGDRVTAWDRVIVHLDYFNDDPALLCEAKKRKRELEEHLSRNMSIDSKGNLLDEQA
jgi:hypothetical protein